MEMNYYTETDKMVQDLLDAHNRSYPSAAGALQVKIAAMLYQLRNEFGEEISDKALEFLK